MAEEDGGGQKDSLAWLSCHKLMPELARSREFKASEVGEGEQREEEEGEEGRRRPSGVPCIFGWSCELQAGRGASLCVTVLSVARRKPGTGLVCSASLLNERLRGGDVQREPEA